MSCFNFRRNYSGGAADLLAPSQGLSEHHASSTAPTVLPSHPSLSNTSSYYDGYPVVSTMTKPAFIPSRGQMGVPDDFIMSPHPSLHMEHAQSTEFPFPQMAPPQPPVPAPVHMPAVGRPKPCPVQVGEKGQSSSRYPPGLNLRTPSFFKRSSYKSIATPPLTPSTPSPPHSDDLFLPEPEDDAPISHEDQHAPVADDMKCDEPTEQQDVAEDEEVTTSSRMLRNHELHPVFAESYVILAELGTGGFGFVVKGVRVSDGVPVAIKFIIKDNMPEHARVTSPLWNNGRTMLPSEAAMLMRINHPGIVGFVDLFEDKNFFYLVRLPFLGSLFLHADTTAFHQVMEHHGSAWSGVDIDPGKQNQAVVSNKSASKSGKPVRPPLCFRRSSCDLFECIEQKKLSEDEARLIFAQMVSVIHYLDANSISHMDIKDENVVIDQNLKVRG